LFFYLLNFFSQGRALGMGDVKLSLVLGLFLGIKLSIVFLWLVFVFGGIVAIFLLLFRLKKPQDKIAFAPFLIFTFFLLWFFPHFRAFFSLFLW